MEEVEGFIDWRRSETPSDFSTARWLEAVPRRSASLRLGLGDDDDDEEEEEEEEGEEEEWWWWW